MPKLIEKRTCLFCDEPISGRADKKFCDDQCRAYYNNGIRSDDKYMRNVNNILRKNRRLLLDLLGDAPDGKGRANYKKLSELGFNFTYHTHTYTNQKGDVYKFCYEVGYRKLENDFYMIVKRNEP